MKSSSQQSNHHLYNHIITTTIKSSPLQLNHHHYNQIITTTIRSSSLQTNQHNYNQIIITAIKASPLQSNHHYYYQIIDHQYIQTITTTVTTVKSLNHVKSWSLKSNPFFLIPSVFYRRPPTVPTPGDCPCVCVCLCARPSSAATQASTIRSERNPETKSMGTFMIGRHQKTVNRQITPGIRSLLLAN